MDQRLQLLLNECKAGLQSLYGNRLRGVYLYGSYARGEADSESDVDVVVVVSDFDHYATEVERTGALGSALSLKYGVSVSEVFVRERDWLRRDTPFLANARAEAVPA